MEKILSFKSQILLGETVPVPGYFATAQTYIPPAAETLEKRGKLFVVATLKGPPHFAVAEAGKLVLDALQAEYFSLLEGSPLPALEKAVAAAHRRLLDLLHGPSLTNKEGVDFNLVAAVLWGQILYLAKLGTAAVYLLRQGALAEIGTAAETQVSVASGLVSDKDVLILGSPSFREQFPPRVLQKDLESLEKLVGEKEKRADLVALIISLFFEETVTGSEVVNFVSWPKEAVEPEPERRSWWHRKLPKALSRPDAGKDTAGLYLEMVPLAERKRRRRRFVALLLLFVTAVFLASVILTLQRSQRQRVVKETAVLGAAIERKILSASDFLDLNNQKARDLLTEAKSDTEKLISLGERVRGESLRQQIEALLIKVNKVQTEVKTSLIYDFATQGKESRPAALFGGEGVLYVADSGTNALYRLDITAPAVKVEQLGVGEITQAKGLTGGDDYLYGLAADGLFRIALSKKVVKTRLIGDLADKTVTALSYYFGNLYLLQAAENNFVKYTPTISGLSAPLPWLKEKADLTGAVSLAVDGDVYFLLKDGSIKKFTAGKPVDFKIINLDKPLSGATVLYTRADLNELYVLDAGNRRLAVFDKNGFYKRQVPLTDKAFLAPATLWVNLAGDTLYLLDGTRVLALEIKSNL